MRSTTFNISLHFSAKAALVALCICFIHSLAFSQANVLSLQGNITDQETSKKLDGVQIIIFQNGNQYDTYDAGGSGKYKLDLALGFSYDIKFSRAEYIAKIIRFDTRNIPLEDQAGGFQSDMSISLLKFIEGFNTDIMKEPYGKAAFQKQENDILFDFGYTENMKKKVEAEIKRLKDNTENASAKKDEFDKLIKEGDAGMAGEKYEVALNKYDAALKIFPLDAPAKQKYADAKAKYDAWLAAQKANEAYNKLLAEGETQMKAKKWDLAKKAYTDAKNLKPTEKLPKEKLYEIEQLLANTANQEAYDKLIAEADKKFGEKNYTPCIDKYKEASKLFPTIAYPKEQITKAQAALDAIALEQKNNADRDKKYNELINTGFKNLNDKKYDLAMAAYQEAKTLKPTEAEPPKRITELEGLMADMAKNNEKAKLDADYNKLIADGDARVKEQKWDDAKKAFNDAKALKPAEKLPKDKLAEIDVLMANAANQAAYDKAIADADAKFGSKDYAISIDKYKEASKLFPTLPYPKEQIIKAQTELDKMLADEKNKADKDKRYQDQMSLGLKNYSDKKYDGALSNYKEAQRIKPEETEPPARIAEIEKLIADLEKQKKDQEALDAQNNALAQLEAEYQGHIKTADAAFQKEELEASKSEYEAALGVKKNDKYAQSRIVEIEKQILERDKRKTENEAQAVAENEAKRIQSLYEDKINAANALFLADKLEEAKVEYIAASEIKPAEKFPKSRIDLIDERLALAAQSAINEKAAEDKRKEDEARQARADALKLEQELSEKRLADERAERDQIEKDRIAKEAAEMAARKETLALQSKAASNVDRTREDQVEEYYREARRIEEAAKWEEQKKKEQDNNEYMQKANTKSGELLARANDDVKGDYEKLARLTENGDAYKLKSTAEVLREKENNDSKTKQYVEGGDSRRTSSGESIEKEKEKQKTTARTKEASRDGNIEKVKEQQETNEKQQEMYASKGDVLRNDHEREADRQKNTLERASYDGEKVRTDKIKEATDKKEEVARQDKDVRDAAVERIAVSEDHVAATKKDQKAFGEGRQAKRQDYILDVNEEKAHRHIADMEKQEQASERGNKARTEEFNKSRGQAKSPEEYRIVPGTESVPEGVSEKSFELGNKNITQRTVKVGNRVDVYIKSVSKYGMYYFKNGQPITESRWAVETLPQP